MTTGTVTVAAADGVAAPLDLLLTDAALGPLRRSTPGGAGLRLAAALAARPGLGAGRNRPLLGELSRVAAGTSALQPSRRDRRFTDPAWAGNPVLHRVMQAYLAASQAAEGAVAGAGLDWADAQRAGFLLDNLVEALAPSNNPVLNPAALKAALDTGGGSMLSGLRNFAADMAASPRVPSMRQAVLDALDAVTQVAGSDRAALMGVCSGGIITAMVAAHLAHLGQQDRIAALTLMVTVLDQSRAGLASAVISERNARMAAAASRARGYLDGRSLAGVFAWLRPGDLVWNYWVNNYLLGRRPPAFDILSWNADTTRMTAGLHRDFLQLPTEVRDRVDQPAAAAAAATAHADPGGRRRPDHPAGRRADHAPADPAQPASRLSRRPPRAGRWAERIASVVEAFLTERGTADDTGH